MTSPPVFPAGAAPVASGHWTVEALLTPTTRLLGLVAVVVSFVFPVGGLGIDLCMFHASTGWPCPGCGLTRAVSAISQGDFGAALALNPFAFFAWPLFVALAVLTVLPRRLRERAEAKLRSVRALGKAYELVFWAFLGFGLLRLAAFVVLQERFP